MVLTTPTPLNLLSTLVSSKFTSLILCYIEHLDSSSIEFIAFYTKILNLHGIPELTVINNDGREGDGGGRMA